MTPQEVFDKVVNHLRTQGARAMDAAGHCKYRGNEGKKCAVGCLIPDTLYHPEMEYKSVDNLLDSFLLKLDFLQDHRVLLRRLQDIHDRSDPAYWERCLSSIAFNIGLTYTPPQTQGS